MNLTARQLKFGQGISQLSVTKPQVIPDRHALVSLNKAAVLMGCGRSWLYKLVESGSVPHYKLSAGKFSHIRFSPAKLAKWLELRAVHVKRGRLARFSEEIESAVERKPWGQA